MIKNFIIPLVVYPFDILVSIGQTDREFKRDLKKVMTEEEIASIVGDGLLSFNPSTMGRTVNMPVSHQTIIRLRAKPKTNEQFGELAHEIFHAVSMILYRIGMPLKIEKSDEAYAYLIGYVTKEIYKRL